MTPDINKAELLWSGERVGVVVEGIAEVEVDEVLVDELVVDEVVVDEVLVDELVVDEVVVDEVVVVLASQNQTGHSVYVLTSVSQPESSHGIWHVVEFVGMYKVHWKK